MGPSLLCPLPSALSLSSIISLSFSFSNELYEEPFLKLLLLLEPVVANRTRSGKTEVATIVTTTTTTTMSAAAIVAANCSCSGYNSQLSIAPTPPAAAAVPQLSRYESQKRRDWNTFGQYLRNHRPPLTLSRCSGAHVLEFLRYLDQFGKTKVHADACPFYGHPHPPAPCPCPLRQAWGSLDALIGRLRAAFEENGGQPETNPFGARAVRLYLREVRDTQAKARGIAYEKKKRKKPTTQQQQQLQSSSSSSSSSDYGGLGVVDASENNGSLLGRASSSSSTARASINIPLSVLI